MCINDVIHIYVDFVPVLFTNSPDDGLALLVAMYSIFELGFDRKSRTVRLLYSVLHAETRYLTNSVRILIREKNIDVNSEQLHRRQQQLLPPQSQQNSIPVASSNILGTTAADTTKDDVEVEAEAECEPSTQLEMNSSTNNSIQDSSHRTSETLDINSTEDQDTNE